MVSFIIIYRGMCAFFVKKIPVFHAARVGTENETREKCFPQDQYGITRKQIVNEVFPIE